MWISVGELKLSVDNFPMNYKFVMNIRIRNDWYIRKRLVNY